MDKILKVNKYNIGFLFCFEVLFLKGTIVFKFYKIGYRKSISLHFLL